MVFNATFNNISVISWTLEVSITTGTNVSSVRLVVKSHQPLPLDHSITQKLYV
jgi:hypothetical protein